MNGSCSDQELPASGTPTIGSDAVVPALVVKTPSTVSSGSSAKFGRLAKKRTVGLSRPTQIGPVVTVPPRGISTEFLSPVPCTYEDSLPETILAPPVKVRPERRLERAARGERVVHRVEPLRERLAHRIARAGARRLGEEAGVRRSRRARAAPWRPPRWRKGSGRYVASFRVTSCHVTRAWTRSLVHTSQVGFAGGRRDGWSTHVLVRCPAHTEICPGAQRLLEGALRPAAPSACSRASSSPTARSPLALPRRGGRARLAGAGRARTSTPGSRSRWSPPTRSSRARSSPRGAGFAVPTQVVLVPMLLLLPTPSVPLLVALALGPHHADRRARAGASPATACCSRSPTPGSRSPPRWC